MNESARHTDEFFRLARDEKRLEEYAEGLLSLAINQAITGRRDEARQQVDRLLKETTPPAGAADELVALGGLTANRALADAHVERSLAHVRASFSAEDRAKAERAIRSLHALALGHYQEAYELGISNGFDAMQRSPLIVAGIAALELQRWDDAARLFETIVGFGPRLYLTPMHAFANIMLGRACAAAGRTAEARQAYEKAFEIWKDADPDLPLLLDARKEYARLSS